MAEIGSAFVSIVPSARGFGKQLDGQVGSDLERSGKNGSKRFGSAFGSGLKSAIAPALAVIGAAAVGGLLKGAIDEASNLNETLNKSSVIFGKGAGEIERFGNSAAKSLGLSKNQAIAAASGFGDMFSQLGFAQKQAVSMSKDVVQLSADLGSFNNLETSDVADRIAAAFRGEYDSLQALIPNINAARVEQVALAATGKKTTKELTAQEKAAAVLAIVHKDGARAAGDFERTSGGLANQQKILSAQTADLKAKIGAALLPVVTKVASYLNTTAIPAFSKFIEEMKNGTGTGGKVADALKDIYTNAKPVALAIAAVVKAFFGLPGATQKTLLLAGAVLLLQNRFAGSIPSLQGFSRESATAALKMTAIRGGALAAGIGMASLSAKVSSANSTMKALTTVGAGIATGFATTGSPFGAAVGGAAGLMAALAGKSASAAAAQQIFRTASSTVTATLNEQTGALTRATRATAAKALADTGAFDAGRKVGASYRDILDASLGNEAAQKRVAAATRDYVKANAASYDSTVRAAKVVATLRESVYGTSSAIADERKKIDQVNQAMGKAKDRTVQFKVETPGLFGTLSALGSLSSAIDKAVAKGKSAKSNIGANAAGTDNWRGGLTVVGEKGPELINLAKGAQVIPNHKIGDVGTATASTSGGAASSRDLESAMRRAVDGATLFIPGFGNARLSAAGA